MRSKFVFNKKLSEKVLKKCSKENSSIRVESSLGSLLFFRKLWLLTLTLKRVRAILSTVSCRGQWTLRESSNEYYKLEEKFKFVG